MRKIYGDYLTQKRLGSGSFGEVWEAINHNTRQRVALKLEPRNSKTPQLCSEAKLYSMFQGSKATNNSVEPCNNIPIVYAFGHTESTNFMAMELLGKSLEDLVSTAQKFSQKTVLMLAAQMISCVEHVHKHKYIHRDIKPDNFAMGVGKNSNKVYLIDFGLAKKYVDANNHHIRNCCGKSLTGTARYASIHTLEGKEQSRRDDMESLFYVWIYLLRGELPWMGLPTKGKNKYEAILMKKRSTNPEELCSGLNSFFTNYYASVRSLRFEEEPNYAMYRKMIYDAMISEEIQFDYCYDWVKPTYIQQRNDIHNVVSNTKRDNALNHVNMKIITHKKCIIRNEKDNHSFSSDYGTISSYSTSSEDVSLSSSSYSSYSEVAPIKPVKPKKIQIIPFNIAKMTEIRTNANQNSPKIISKYLVAAKEEVETANKPMQTQAKVCRDSDQSSTKGISPIQTNQKQNDGIHQANDKTALNIANPHKHPISYRTAMLPKWMMARTASTR